eukprot:TRINITY_DN2254_c0_g3_i4.p1 TRINITY_DN2254_c0_g3~~TRINITY_DN2254_c0_g3_i4.p1  ORF type:complete len:215 (-),score=90.48 TRINITY_DN2254_c0_g3_i4:51-695(-)
MQNQIHGRHQRQRYGYGHSLFEMDGVDSGLGVFEDDVEGNGNHSTFDDEYGDINGEEEEKEEEEEEEEWDDDDLKEGNEFGYEMEAERPIEWSELQDSEPKSDDEFFMRRVVGELDDEITKFQTLRAKLSDARRRPKSTAAFSSYGPRAKDGINRTMSTSQIGTDGVRGIRRDRGWSAHGSKRKGSLSSGKRERSRSTSKVDEWQELHDLIERF